MQSESVQNPYAESQFKDFYQESVRGYTGVDLMKLLSDKKKLGEFVLKMQAYLDMCHPKLGYPEAAAKQYIKERGVELVNPKTYDEVMGLYTLYKDFLDSINRQAFSISPLELIEDVNHFLNLKYYDGLIKFLITDGSSSDDKINPFTKHLIDALNNFGKFNINLITDKALKQFSNLMFRVISLTLRKIINIQINNRTEKIKDELVSRLLEIKEKEDFEALGRFFEDSQAYPAIRGELINRTHIESLIKKFQSGDLKKDDIDSIFLDAETELNQSTEKTVYKNTTKKVDIGDLSVSQDALEGRIAQYDNFKESRQYKMSQDGLGSVGNSVFEIF